MKHSSIGPSSFFRLHKCPGSGKFEIGPFQVDKEESEAAKRGSRLHDVADATLTGKDFDMEAFLLEDEVDILSVDKYVTVCKDLMNRKDCVKWGSETRIELDYIDFKLFGTCDFWAIIGTDLWVVDYKSGSKRVNAEKQTFQLNYYAYGLLKTLNFQPSVVRTVIVQPKTNKHPRKLAWTAEDFYLWIDNVFIRTYNDLIDPDVKSLAEGDHCFFCPARFICPKKNEDVNNIMDKMVTKEKSDGR